MVSRGVRVPEGTVHGPSPDTTERVSDSQDAGEGTGAGAGAGAAFVLLAVREEARNASWNKVGAAEARRHCRGGVVASCRGRMDGSTGPPSDVTTATGCENDDGSGKSRRDGDTPSAAGSAASTYSAPQQEHRGQGSIRAGSASPLPAAPSSSSSLSTSASAASTTGCGCVAATVLEPDEITISITPTTGGQFDLTVDHTDTVENLKKIISKRLKVAKERICLLHRERLVAHHASYSHVEYRLAGYLAGSDKGSRGELSSIIDRSITRRGSFRIFLTGEGELGVDLALRSPSSEERKETVHEKEERAG